MGRCRGFGESFRREDEGVMPRMRTGTADYRRARWWNRPDRARQTIDANLRTGREAEVRAFFVSLPLDSDRDRLVAVVRDLSMLPSISARLGFDLNRDPHSWSEHYLRGPDEPYLHWPDITEAFIVCDPNWIEDGDDLTWTPLDQTVFVQKSDAEARAKELQQRNPTIPFVVRRIPLDVPLTERC